MWQMRTSKYLSSKVVGNELENEVKELLIASGIPFKQESTVNMARKRVKGSVDFILENPIGFIECKKFTQRITFKYKSEDHDIKWSQIEFLHRKYLEGYLAGFILKENSDNRLIFVCISDFMRRWINVSSKSINVKQALSIGRIITNCEFVRGRNE